MFQGVSRIRQLSEVFLRKHAVGQTKRDFGVRDISGEFSFLPDQSEPDLYGMIDAVYILHILGLLPRCTSKETRSVWAERILACQDDHGWFSKLNLTHHCREHATAYAIGALKLLVIEPGEHYLDHIEPLTSILSILDRSSFDDWISHLGFHLSPRHILSLCNRMIKGHDLPGTNWGWHHVWLGSHIGGGVAAIVGMAQHLFEGWGAVSSQWFDWYFEWLDVQANPRTGFWQRAFWNWVYRKPTLIDMGGAVHFFWIYEALGRSFPYPEQVLLSTLPLQRNSGLYKEYPYCVDLDGNYCVIRSYLQLSEKRQQLYREQVHWSIEANFEAIVKSLTRQALEQIYSDSHGLPGALSALVECAVLPEFKYAGLLEGWQHPLDCVWWL